ncbi:MAG: NAD(P)/FAD-dependent oxidoreductase [candidate division Zixibacteria bacterium]|nr:NAD(P)/FAD-dependent oxidoreductase [candidate division Zixibacteria bacterium]
MATRHVIVGGGPAGMNAIETIRGYDANASITLISGEPAYARMALPYYISGNVPEMQVMTGDDAYYSRLGVTTKFGVRVTGVDSASGAVKLSDGSSVGYDNLLIATGSSAQKPSILGADGAGVYNLWTIDDARKTVASMKSGAEVAFIGAGFIGFIILNAMYKLGAKLHVIEVENQVLPRMLDAQGASLVRSWLNQRQVTSHTGARVNEIVHNGNKKTLKLSDGSTVQADIVIVATGIKTNIDFLQGSGVKTNQGVLVDNHCRTNIANIYAAGDVAEGPDLSTGGQAIHAIQPTAVDHGRIAGANMAGQHIAYPGSLLMNILDVCGLQCASFGLWKGEGLETTITVNAVRPVYRKLIWKGDKLVGAILLGPADDVAMLNDMGMIKGLIQTGTALGAWKRHIEENPTDIRRPYVATKTAEKLLALTALGKPAAHRAYRSAQDTPKERGAHAVLVGSKG